jgi:N-acetylglucosamine-6-phosphate deacetylase
MLMHRHENIIQRVLSLAEHLYISFIPDGAHVAFGALRNYLRCAGIERSVIVTDAISAAGLGPGRYTLGRWDIVIGDDMVARAPDGSHLLGAAITMRQCERNLIERVGLSPDEVRALLELNPAKAITAPASD